jgi:hypothetical protein
MLASFPDHVGVFVGAVVDAVTAIQSVLPGYVPRRDGFRRNATQPVAVPGEGGPFRPQAALGMAIGGVGLGGTDGLGGVGAGIVGAGMTGIGAKLNVETSSKQPDAADPFIDTRVFGTRESMVQRFGEKAVRRREQAFEQGLRAGADQRVIDDGHWRIGHFGMGGPGAAPAGVVSNAFYGTREDMVRDLGEEEVCRREADVSRCLAAAPGYSWPPKHFTRKETHELARAILDQKRGRAAANPSITDDDRCAQPPDHSLEELCAPLPCVSNRCLGAYARGADFAPSGTVSQTLISTIADSLTRCADGGPRVPPLPPMPRLTARRLPTPLTYAEGLTTDPLVSDMPQQPPIHDPADHNLYTRRAARMPNSDE